MASGDCIEAQKTKHWNLLTLKLLHLWLQIIIEFGVQPIVFKEVEKCEWSKVSNLYEERELVSEWRSWLCFIYTLWRRKTDCNLHVGEEHGCQNFDLAPMILRSCLSKTIRIFQGSWVGSLRLFRIGRIVDHDDPK